MNMKIIKIIALLLVLSGSLIYCSDKINDEPNPDPEKAILGKWELVLLTRNMGQDEQQYTPTGYIEYLPDSLMAWYDYATKKYTILERKYWLEEVDNPDSDNIPNKYWILHYQGLWIGLGDGTGYYSYGDYPDCISYDCNRNKGTFFSNNRMGLIQLCVMDYVGSYTYIYERKK